MKTRQIVKSQSIINSTLREKDATVSSSVFEVISGKCRAKTTVQQQNRKTAILQITAWNDLFNSFECKAALGKTRLTISETLTLSFTLRVVCSSSFLPHSHQTVCFYPMKNAFAFGELSLTVKMRFGGVSATACLFFFPNTCMNKTIGGLTALEVNT